MNNFFKKKQIILFFVLCSLVLVALLFSYGKLAVQDLPTVAQSKPTVERGSIVDRHGYPLAVPTNFYHIGVTVKDIKNKDSFAQRIAVPLQMESSEISRIISSSKNFVLQSFL